MNNISNAIALHESGRLAEAELLYRELLKIDPNHSEALHWLGVVGFQMGKYNAAQELIQKSIDLGPAKANYYSHLGLTQKALKQYEKAIHSFEKAIEIQPTMAEAYNNIGNIFRARCGFKEAESYYRRALTFNPNLVQAYKNMGDSLRMQGKKKESLVFYKKATAVAPDTFSAHDSSLSLAIDSYLHNDLRSTFIYLKSAKKMFGGINRESIASQIYCNYLQYLLDWWVQKGQLSTQTSTNSTLFVVGESHSLAPHNTLIKFKNKKLRCEARWIEGCKAWHLANREQNVYKYQAAKIFEQLPKKSTVLLTLGEIDCRHNMGIFPLWQKKRASIQELIQNTVSGYLDFIVPLIKNGKIDGIICGVPACNANLDGLSASEVVVFGAFLNDFNTQLSEASLSRGLKFLDVFGLTNKKEGFADGLWHLDSHHLKPDSLMTAFDSHLYEHNLINTEKTPIET